MSTSPSAVSSAKVAIVTGANRGIGRAIARRLAGDGFRLILTARDSALLEETGAEIQKRGGSAQLVPGDLRDISLPEHLVKAALAEYGRVDVLVNNAGATKRGNFLDLSDADWSDGFALKFFGAVRLIRAAWPQLKLNGGSVVNISGIGGRTPGAEFAIGGSVNAALLSLTKALADQGITDGVQVNTINPGRIKTDRLVKRLAIFANERQLSPEDAEREMIAQAGIARFGEPEEVADFVAYLVSPQGRFFQGSLVELDGGETKTI